MRIAAEANITAAAFKATNRLCDIGWDRRCARGSQAGAPRGNPRGWLRVRRRTWDDGARTRGRRADARWCENARIDDRSSTALNRRPAPYIDTRRAAWAAELGLAVAYFDDHTVQDCCHARDTIHQWELVWARISALGDTLQSRLYYDSIK